MIGLLRKEMYMVGWMGLLMLLLSLVISLLPRMENMSTAYPITLAVMVPLYAASYDERCKWDRYAAMLPYRTEQIVWSKYILSYTFIALGEAAALLSGLLRNLIRPDSVNWASIFRTSAMVFVMVLLIATFGLPTLYRFGVEKGRLIVCLVMGALLFTSLAVYMALLRSEVRLPPAAAAGIAVLSIVLNVVSFPLSVHFYKKRQNGDYDT